MASGQSASTVERRAAVGEVRSLSAGKLAGYAAVFNKESVDLGDFKETLAPGCFTNALRTSDIRGLFNNNQNIILGRVRAGTMRVWQDSKGLAFEIDPPNTKQGRVVVEAVRRGDVTQCSFTFTVAKDGARWSESGGNVLRTITEVEKIFALGPAVFAAFEDTVVSARAKLDGWAARSDASLRESDRLLRLDNIRHLSRETAGQGPLYRERRRLALASNPDDARSTAIHEAGHAVADYLEGNDLLFLCFKWSTDDRQFVGGSYYHDEDRFSPDVLLAGIAAQRLFGFTPSDDEWASDRYKVIMQRSAVDYDAEIQRVMHRLQRVRPAITALADELMRQTELDGVRAEEIIRSALARAQKAG